MKLLIRIIVTIFILIPNISKGEITQNFRCYEIERIVMSTGISNNSTLDGGLINNGEKLPYELSINKNEITHHFSNSNDNIPTSNTSKINHHDNDGLISVNSFKNFGSIYTFKYEDLTYLSTAQLFDKVIVARGSCEKIDNITLVDAKKRQKADEITKNIVEIFLEVLYGKKEQLNSEDLEETIELLIEAKDNGEDLNEVIKNIDAPKELLESIVRMIEEREAAKLAEEEAKAKTDNADEQGFETIYYEFAGTLTTNLANSRKMLQISLAVSSEYDETVMINVEAHELRLRSVILESIGNFSEDAIKGEQGRQLLATTIKDTINAELEELEGFGGIEGVHFTSFVMQ